MTITLAMTIAISIAITVAVARTIAFIGIVAMALTTMLGMKQWQ